MHTVLLTTTIIVHYRNNLKVRCYSMISMFEVSKEWYKLVEQDLDK